jgi:hypothetical protein
MRYGLRFFIATLIWTVILVTFTVANQLIAGLAEGSPWEVANLFHQVPTWLGLILPYAAFAGGITASPEVPARQVAAYALPVAALAYLLMAYVAPIAKYEVERDMPAEAAPYNRFGPQTPSAIWELRSLVEADPPREYSYSTDDPLLRPPSWLTHLIHSKIVLALFAILSALLGQRVGVLTVGRSPPARRNIRWALGLLTATLFFLAQVVGGVWIKSDPAHSGVLGSWICLVVPSIELLVLYRLSLRRQSRLHALESPSV